MAASAFVAHRMPGRIRLRIPDKRRNPSYFSRLQQEVAQLDGVRQVRINADTASVLLEFNGDAAELLARLREHDVDVQLKQEYGSAPRRAAHLPLPAKPIRLVTGRNIGPMFMFGTALLGIGLVQALRGRVLVPSMSAFWYAVEAFRQSGKAGR